MRTQVLPVLVLRHTPPWAAVPLTAMYRMRSPLDSGVGSATILNPLALKNSRSRWPAPLPVGASIGRMLPIASALLVESRIFQVLPPSVDRRMPTPPRAVPGVVGLV